MQLVAVRVEARAGKAAPPMPRLRKGTGKPAPAARLGERRAYVPGHGARIATVWDRRALRAGDRLRGPAIVEGGDHTALLPPGARARVGARGELEVVL